MKYAVRRPARMVVAVLCACLLAACGNDGGWRLPEQSATGITPRVGSYSFSASGCFSVIEDPGTTERFVEFASDCFRFDTISIKGGAFRRTHGKIDGTDCPTDSYGIAGHFVTDTRAEGTIKYAFDCNIRRREEFVAEFIE